LAAIFEVGPTTLVQGANFAVLFGALKFVLYDPLTQAIKDRQDKINREMDEAESVNAQAKMLKDQYEEKLKKIKEEGSEYYQKTLAEAEAVKNERLRTLEEDLQKMREKSEKDLAARQEKAMAALRKQMGDLALTITGKLLHGVLTPELQKQLLASMVKEIGNGDGHGL